MASGRHYFTPPWPSAQARRTPDAARTGAINIKPRFILLHLGPCLTLLYPPLGPRGSPGRPPGHPASRCRGWPSGSPWRCSPNRRRAAHVEFVPQAPMDRRHQVVCLHKHRGTIPRRSRAYRRSPRGSAVFYQLDGRIVPSSGITGTSNSAPPGILSQQASVVTERKQKKGAEKGSERFVPVFRCLWHLGVGAMNSQAKSPEKSAKRGGANLLDSKESLT